MFKTVKRNINSFPQDFMFRLTNDEATALSGSQFVILKRGQNIKSLQHVFIENGGTTGITKCDTT
jgi:hypothetical protein